MNYALVNIVTNIVDNLIVVDTFQDFVSSTHYIVPTLDVADISDIYDPVTNTFTKVEKEPEEIPREDMPKLSMVDFRRKLRAIRTETVEDGIYEEDILEKISQIADKELAAEARDYFLYAQYIERVNPWVEILGSMFGLTSDQIDYAWIN